MSRSTPATGSKRIDVLTVTVGGRSCAVEAGRVEQVLETPPVTRVPRAPDAVSGVANVNGELTVVLDLHALLGVESADGGRLLRFEGEYGGHPMAVPVDRVGELTPVSADRITPTDGEDARLFAAYARPSGEDPRAILDPERLIAIVWET